MRIVQIRGIFELKEDRRNINMSVYSIFIYTVPCFFNSHACFVFAWSKSCVSVQLDVCPLLFVCEAGSDSKSCLLMAFLCSVSRVSIFLEVCPM